MSLSRRLLVAAACLAAGVVVQLALQLHLALAPHNPYPNLQKELAACPLGLRLPAAPDPASGTSTPDVWQGVDLTGLPELRTRLPFEADDLLFRGYQALPSGPPVVLYIVYSRAAEDRKHHPEVCIREVAGAPEEPEARGLVYLDAEQRRAVQRFRFRTGTGQHTTVYYWHYTFEPVPQPGQSLVQLLHQRLSQPAPSLTVQVSSLASPTDLISVETSFLVALDAELQKTHLPAGTRIGCDRLPVSLIRE